MTTEAIGVDREPKSGPPRLVGWVTIALLLGIAIIRLIQILGACGGLFIYPLDDPYIDLQFAAEVAHGHYGLTDGAIASPASSILYPLLLVAVRPFDTGLYAPLLVNLIAASLSVAALAHLIARSGAMTTYEPVARAVLLLFAIGMSINLIDLALMGLEHSIHQLVSILIVIGTAAAIDGRALRRSSPIWLMPLCATAPLWRLEALDLVACACLALALAGARRLAATIAGATAATMAVYFTIMRLAGLPLLPSSVLAKWVLTKDTSGNPAVHVWHAMGEALGRLEALIPLTVAVVFVTATVLAKPGPARHRNRLLVAVYCGVLLGHFAFGAWGWLGRYSPYILATAAATGLLIWEEQLRRLLTGGHVLKLAAICPLLLATTLRPEMISVASGNVFEQQYQMRQFVEKYYRAPVAANDIGFLSWNSPYPCLDLWGVSDETARQARAAGQPGWLERLVRAHNIGLVMLYADWFPGQIPAGWERVATLDRSGMIMTGERTVSFYATSSAAAGRITAALAAFRVTLPPGPVLHLTGDAN